MLTPIEIARALKDKLDSNGRIRIITATEMLSSTEGFHLEEYGLDSIKDLFDEFGGDFSTEEEFLVISGDTLSSLFPPIPESSSPDDKQGLKPDPILPDWFDLDAFNKSVAFLIYEECNNKEPIPLTVLGQKIKQAGLTLPPGFKLRAIMEKSPELFIIEFPAPGSCFISLTPTGVKRAKSDRGPIPPKKPTVLMSRYAIQSFCVISPVNVFLEELAKIAAPDGWFIIDDPAENQPYRLLLRKLELDFAMAMRDELQGKESPFKTGMTRGTYRTNFHTYADKPIYLEMEFNAQRDTTTMAPWKFKRFFIGD